MNIENSCCPMAVSSDANFCQCETKKERLAMLSHDMRGPLTNISLSLSFLEAGHYGELNERGKVAVDKTQAVVNRMVMLIDNFLTVESMKCSSSRNTSCTVRFEALCTSAIESLDRLAEKKSLKIVVQNGSTPIFCPKEQVVRVITNIIANAIEFSPTDASIIISAQTIAGFVEVTVADSGPGLRIEQCEKIFDLCSRVGRADNGRVRGFGMGLKICKTIIEDLKGNIGVRSNLGNGSTFWFRLPQ